VPHPEILYPFSAVGVIPKIGVPEPPEEEWSKAAFTGQLVPQDPTDEPASALLARIRAERAAADRTKPIRSPKKRLKP